MQYNPNKPGLASAGVIGTMGNSLHIYDTSSALSSCAFSLTGWHFVGWNTSTDGNGDYYADGASISTLNDTSNGITILYAQWEANQFTVIYQSNKPDEASNNVVGTMIDSSHIYDSAASLSLNQYSILGWDFVGWNTCADASGATWADQASVRSFDLPHNSTVTLYAQWQIIQYSISYENLSNGVNPNKDLVFYTVEDATITFANPLKTGYEGSWNIDSIPQGSTGDKTITALWTAIVYSITYNNLCNGSNVSGNPSTYTIEDATITFAYPVRTGYEGGWDIDGIPQGSTGDKTIVAVWTPITYQVHYLPNKPAQVTGEYEVSGTVYDTIHTYDVSQSLSTSQYTLLGWEFMGWSLSADGSTGTLNSQSVLNLSNIQNQVVNVYAQWRIIYYVYTINYDGDTPDFVGYYTIETPTITFVTRDIQGYTVWFEPASIPQYSTGNQEITEQVIPIDYSITYDLNGGENGDNPSSIQITDTVQLLQATKTGHIFLGWLYNGQYITVLNGVSNDILLVADWAQSETISAITSEYIIRTAVAYITLPSTQFTTSCRIVVESSAQILYIYSTTNLEYSLYIDILDRNADVEIILSNVRMKAPLETCAISMSSAYTLSISTIDSSICSIKGGDGRTGTRGQDVGTTLSFGIGGTGGTGASAISCYHLVLNSSNINLYGGNGGTGGKGGTGQGTPGGPGGTGGNGYYAVITIAGFDCYGHNVNIQGGNGGRGGNGGDGNMSGTSSQSGIHARGGSGGSGSSAVLGDITYHNNQSTVYLQNGTSGARGFDGANATYL